MTNNNGSNADDRFPGERDENFGLVPEITTWSVHEETAAKRNQKDPNHLSCKLTANFNDEKLEKMSLQTLNKKSDTLARKFGKRRRVLKNRKYGLKCRKRDSEKTDNITEENAALELKILKAKIELRNVASERDEFKLKYERLNKTLGAFHSNGQKWRP